MAKEYRLMQRKTMPELLHETISSKDIVWGTNNRTNTESEPWFPFLTLGTGEKKGRKEDFSIAVGSAVEIMAARTPENG